MSSKVACLYIRVSTEDQTELSPDAQKRLLLDYAQKNDMIVSGAEPKYHLYQRKREKNSRMHPIS